MTDSRPRGRPRRLRTALGAASLRVMLALGASTGLTAAVALPMAYQAHEARQSEQPPAPARTDPAWVLGTSLDRDEKAVSAEGVTWIAETPEDADDVEDPGDPVAAEPVLLQDAAISGAGRIVIDIDGIARADLRLDDGEVYSRTEEPFEVTADGEALGVPLDPGPHTLTATVALDDGTVTLRQVSFTVE